MQVDVVAYTPVMIEFVVRLFSSSSGERVGKDGGWRKEGTMGAASQGEMWQALILLNDLNWIV